MNLQNKILITIGVLVVLGLGVYFPRGNTMVQQVTQQLGAASGTTHTQTEEFLAGIGGIQQGIMSTSTVVCRAQNPLPNASTTFTAALAISTATTTATSIMLGTTTAANLGLATTGPASILTTPFAANSLGSVSYVGAQNQNVLGPGQWVYFGYTNGTGAAGLGGLAQQQFGSCNFRFYKI